MSRGSSPFHLILTNDQEYKFLLVVAIKPTRSSFWGNDVIKSKLVIKIRLVSFVYVSHVVDDSYALHD